MATPWEEFWWNNITSVADTLLENKMVVLKVPADLPWRHSMRGAIHTAFQGRSASSDVVIETIDIVDDNPKDTEPGRFILDRYASLSISRGYREKSRITVQEYILAKEVIKNRIIWVKGLADKTAEKWMKFCRGFSQCSAETGLFVLEIHGKISVLETRLLKCIDFGNYVSSYDVQLFNSFILDRREEYSETWKRYISTSAALVCDSDAEISEMLLRTVDFKTQSVLDGIKEIADMPEFLRRGGESDSNHVLWHYRNMDTAELLHRVWCSQVQVLFPIIELERVQIIEKWKQPIQEALNDNSITQYGELLRDAIDVELGTLCFMMKHRVNSGLYMLYIPDEEERERIDFLHDCRNQLAHAVCCTTIQIVKLLDKNIR